MIGDDDFLYLCLCFGKYRRDRIQRNSFPQKPKCVCCGRRFGLRNFEDYVQRQYYLGPGTARVEVWPGVLGTQTNPFDASGRVRPRKPRFVCRGCDIGNKVKVAAGTLYQLVRAVPVAERDRNEIYPADFRYPQIPLWREEKMRLPGLGLRDYASLGRLLLRSGSYEVVIRQKAASPVRDIPATSFRAWDRLVPLLMLLVLSLLAFLMLTCLGRPFLKTT
jgi:hypothetical protein